MEMTNYTNKNINWCLAASLASLAFVASSYSNLLPQKTSIEKYHITKSGTFNPDSTITTITNRSGSTLIGSIEVTDEVTETLPNHLENIKSAFSLTNDDLAKIIGVTRKTLHNWKTGKIGNSEKRQRVFELFMLATDWNKIGFSKNKHDLNQPIVHGKSVVDLLSEENLNREKILFAGSRIALLNNTPEQGLF